MTETITPPAAVATAAHLNAIPEMTDPLGRYWQQPTDIRQAPMDPTHVLLTQEQADRLMNYDASYPSGKYFGKCWRRTSSVADQLCWYYEHPDPGKIGIGARDILIL